MKITVKANELAKKMSRALGVVQAKVTIPVLAYVKVNVDNAQQATISGSDLGMSMIQTVAIELKSETAGAILIPAKKLSEYLAPLPSDSIVTIETEGEGLRITSGKLLKAKLSGVSVSLFPVIEPRPAAMFNINAAALKKVIARVENAAPSKAGKHSVPSILLQSTAAGLRAVATDGFRIAVADAPGAGAGDFEIQLPKTFTPLIKEIPGEVIQFSKSDTNYFFASGGEELLIRIPTTKFPNVGKAVATVSFNTEINVAVPSLKSAIGIISPTSDAKSPAVVLDFAAAELTLTSTSNEGTTESGLDVTLVGAPNKVKLNQNFIMDFLGNSEGQAKVQLIDASSLVKFSNGADYQYFVMPMVATVAAPKEEKPKA